MPIELEVILILSYFNAFCYVGAGPTTEGPLYIPYICNALNLQISDYRVS